MWMLRLMQSVLNDCLFTQLWRTKSLLDPGKAKWKTFGCMNQGELLNLHLNFDLFNGSLSVMYPLTSVKGWFLPHYLIGSLVKTLSTRVNIWKKLGKYNPSRNCFHKIYRWNVSGLNKIWNILSYKLHVLILYCGMPGPPHVCVLVVKGYVTPLRFLYC